MSPELKELEERLKADFGKKPTLWDYSVGKIKDALVLFTFLSILFGGMTQVTRPFWEPFAALPERMAELQLQLNEVDRDIDQFNLRFREMSEPQVVEFRNVGIITNTEPVPPGGTINAIYLLRRNIDCPTVIEPYFINVETNQTYAGEVFFARRSSVSEHYQSFPIPIELPSHLPDGRYVYAPIMDPQDCGVYQRIVLPLSTIFEVRR